MKTKLSRTKLKEKELTEASLASEPRRGRDLRRLNSNSKAKGSGPPKAKSRSTINKASFVNLLPDQQSEKELCYDIRPCCVKIRRINPTVSTIRNIQKLNEDYSIHTSSETSSKNQLKSQSRIRNSKAKNTTDKLQHEVLDQAPCFKIRPFCVKVLRLKADAIPRAKNNGGRENSYETSIHAVENNCNRSGEQQINKNHNSPAKISKHGYIFRNPALALTTRKAREKQLVKDSIREESIENSTTLFEPNKNSTMNALPAANPDAVNSVFNKEVVSSTSSQNNLSPSQFNEPSAILEVLLPEKPIKEKSPAKTQTKKNKYQRRTSKIFRHNSADEADIYEFLSQSQSSVSESNKHKDPAADIIKMLIDQGKVAVTKNVRGKPVVIHKKGVKRKPKVKRKSLQKKGKIRLKLTKQFQPTHAVTNEDENEKHVHFVDDCFGPVENTEAIPSISDVPETSNKTNRKSNNATAVNNQGTYNSLTRSVLMQQTNQTNSARQNVINKERLLEITRRHISTPFRKPAVALLTDDANLSPIHKTTITGNYITSRDTSIEANNSKNNASYRPSLPAEISADLSLSFPTKNKSSSFRTIRDKTQQQQLSLSSFSSNDSNAENMSPPPRIAGIQSNDENALVFNARQNLNPRRTLLNRSPLKTINIIDVITLPPFRGHINKDNKVDRLKNNEKYRSNFDSEEYSDNDQTELHEEASIKSNEAHSALFGFEEYLHEDQNELHEESINKKNNNNTNLSNLSLHEQLKKLKKWRPNVPRYKDTKSSTITKRIFDDDFNQNRGQKDIRNLLCSTMINKQSVEAQNTAISLMDDGGDDSDEVFEKTLKDNTVLDLFGDPESTFDQKRLHRTYERPFKRKRKLQHQYSIHFDSEDESESEDDHHNTSIKKKVKHHDKHPRHHHGQCEKASDPELDKFVSEFNSMIKEAEEYQLIVE